MNKKLFFIISLFVWFIFVAFFTISTSVFANKTDILTVTNNVTESHIELRAINNILYILPPESSFTCDTNRQFLGLSSAKYPDITMQFTYSGEHYPDNDSLINLKYKMLKKITVMKVNDKFKLWGYKVQSQHNDNADYTWFIFIDDNISYIQGTFSYDKKYDNIFDKSMEKVVKSIVNVANPDITPEYSITCIGDYSILGLKFVPQVMVPVAYFTEDAYPFKSTNHSRMLAIASPPSRLNPEDNKIDVAIATANQILYIAKLNDSVIVEQIGETEINGNKGYWIKGSLQNNDNKRLIIYYVDDVDNYYFLILGLCDSVDEKDFFEKIDKFKTTFKRNT